MSAPAGPSPSAADDRHAICELLAHYCFLVDSGYHDRLADEVYTADAVDDHGLGEWRGSDAIRRAFAETMARFEGTAHVLGNVHVELDGDRARSRAYVTAWHWLADRAEPGTIRPADFVVLGAYLDDLRREPAGWRIARRRFRPVGPSVLAVGELPDFLLPR
ncbi:MAG: nuclear transport factor 2 family protein [Acidimicrobiia bacterium]|nr:nuclear transport factor 2 family protein [Acidimicrobiia bacterium]